MPKQPKQKKDKTLRIMQRIGQIAPGVIAAHFSRADTCIASTRIAIAVAEAFGVKLEPLSVRVTIFNPPFAARIKRGQRPRDFRETVRWGEEDGSWSFCIGYGAPQAGKWAGHLVGVARVEVPNRSILGDLALAQAIRPQREIVIPHSLVYYVPDVLLAGEERYPFETEAGCIAVYEAVPDDTSYEVSRDWQHPERHQRIIDEIIARVRQVR